MSTIQGVGASVSMPSGFGGKARAINATVEINATDTTGFSDLGWPTSEPVGPIRVAGSIDLVAEYGAADSPVAPTLFASPVLLTAAQASMTLTFQTGCALAFTANVTSVGLTRNVRDAMGTATAFESTGAVTQSWDAS